MAMRKNDVARAKMMKKRTFCAKTIKFSNI